MKIKRYNEDNLSDEYVRVECRDLFKNLWSEKLALGQISVTGLNNDCDLRVKVYTDITNETLKDFTELFSFLDNLNIKFSFFCEQQKLVIDINNNMDKFISEMKNEVDIKKYNL